MRRISNRQVAIALAMSEVEVGRILNGVVRPTSRFRERLAKYLEEPEHTLFRDAA